MAGTPPTKVHRGWEFVMLPGPSNVPDRILRALSRPVIDHRGPEFQRMVLSLLPRLRTVFGTADAPVVIYPSSGTGAWEAALVNTMSPGDSVMMFDCGHFAAQWRKLAERIGLQPVVVPGDWRRGPDPEEVRARLEADTERRIRAVCVVHNETSTGAVARVAEIRAAIDRAAHPCLLIVDTVSGAGSIEYRHDAWGVDVSVCASQKGLMLPPGLGFNVVGAKALAAAERARCPRSYWGWREHIEAARKGMFPYTLPTSLLYGLDEALTMLLEEGLPAVWARHRRLGDACRAAAAHWGLELVCDDPREHSDVVTAVRVPPGADADALRAAVLRDYGLVLGNGLGRLQGRVFRIGHLGAVNELMLTGALGGVEMGLRRAGIAHRPGGVQAAVERLAPPAAARL